MAEKLKQSEPESASVYIKVLLLIIVAILFYSGYMVISASYDAFDRSVTLVEKYSKDGTGDFLCKDCIKEGYGQAIIFFSVAVGILLLIFLLPRLENISFGGVSITLSKLKDEIDDLKTQNNDLQEKLVDSGGGKTLTVEKQTEVRRVINKQASVENVKYPDDPQKGKWGGLSENKGRKISAEVLKSEFPGLYTVKINVASTSKSELSGLVKFYLHNTFRNSQPVIAVKNGSAELILYKVYGAFTVGAVTSDGTNLELDLSELPGIPDDFKNK